MHTAIVIGNQEQLDDVDELTRRARPAEIEAGRNPGRVPSRHQCRRRNHPPANRRRPPMQAPASPATPPEIDAGTWDPPVAPREPIAPGPMGDIRDPRLGFAIPVSATIESTQRVLERHRRICDVECVALDVARRG
jgi:hypothetical protein